MFNRSCWAIICNILETKHSQSNAAEKEEIPESSLCMIPVFFVCDRSEIVTTFSALICNSPGILFMFWWYMLQCFLSRWSWKQKYHNYIHDLTVNHGWKCDLSFLVCNEKPFVTFQETLLVVIKMWNSMKPFDVIAEKYVVI